MEFTSSDSIWELMLTKRPSDTYFSQSSTPGGKSPLARDDDNMLNTHAVLFDGTKTALVIVGAGVALGVAAAPYVKSGRLGFSQAAFLHAARKATRWRIRTVGGGGTGIEGATEGEAWVRRGAATGSTWPTR